MFGQMLDAQQRFQNILLAKANVVGVAVGYRDFMGEATDELALVALVEQKKPIEALDPRDLVPRDIDGAVTDVVEVGFLRAEQSLTPRSRWRPIVPSGVSIGHYKVTAGTLGTMVTDRDTGQLMILSNNHVMANSNDAMAGDAILQPGPTDHGQNPADMVARLERWVPLRYIGDPIDSTPTPPPVDNNPGDNNGGTRPPTTESGCDIVDIIVSLSNVMARAVGSEKQLTAKSSVVGAQVVADPVMAQQVVPTNGVDCAVASVIEPDTFSGEILNIGAISGIAEASLGMRVRKSGRTTGYTEGIVSLVNATVDVAYATAAGTKTARFTGQVLTNSMSAGGDSGSLIVAADAPNAVGLLFAGSSVSTIFTPIQSVLDALNVNLYMP
ncbi:hypothetical protein G4Y79_23590 [Phototrophicus methaneseepsis]|uniref:Uncharacterized protein n=1 Tax=Phototrophicus methaneseepsis TaxID=2710758 RepID=A0A7S8IEI6_9CHLR|nr:hypothetical protein [Phototrophicus methaneseepsis]QPC82636.1 hypothetical protein G4Y79_23590 [Phototrophicus methaneseepsis]